MTERLVIRVALRDESEQAAGRSDRRPLSKPARRRRGPWIVGGAVAVGLSIIVAVALLTDFSGGRSVQDNAAGSETRTNDRGPLETGGDPQTDTAAFSMEPAARPTLERESVPAQAAVRPTPSDIDTGVVEETERPVRPSGAARKSVEKPESAAPPDAMAPERREMASDVAAEDGTGPATAAASGGAEETEAEHIASAITDPRVLRAQLSAGIREKEPTVRLQSPIQVTGRSDRTIYFFSEVRDFGGQTLVHRWEREGRVLATIPFEIRGQRWRVYSRKTITPRMTGRWRVVLADSTGKELAGSAFSVR